MVAVDQQVARATTRRPVWWREVLLILVFYSLYSLVRNRFGSAQVADGAEPVQAFTNAVRIIDWERALGLFHEETIQSWFLGWSPFLQLWNTFYGTAHFVVTIVAFVLLYLRLPDRFSQWRNVLGVTTALAIVGFALFPVMPPRLLDEGGPYGGGRLVEELQTDDFDFVDTLDEYGGPWSFDSGAMQKVSNQYAAMPSLHIAWSMWSVLVLWQLTTRWWARALLVLYPVATLFCIVVTGNHFWLDGLGGLVALGLGYVIGTAIDRWWRARKSDATDAAQGALA